MKYALLQSLILLLLLTIFAVADFGFIIQYHNLITLIEELPIVIFSHDWELLESIRFELQDNSLTGNIILERNIEILDKMINEYELPAADQILDIDLLPNMLQFSLIGSQATKTDFLSLKATLENRETGLMIISQDNDLENLLDLKEQLVLIKLILLLGTLVMLFFAALAIRIISIRKENNYWDIYYRSGGRQSRFKYYFFHSLIASILPITCFALMIYLAKKYLQLTYYLDLKTWLLILVVILITRPLAWFSTRKD